MKQFLTFVQKEFFHIFRDRRTMLILLVMPVMLIVLFGYAITTEVKDTRTAILDTSRDAVTTQIREKLAANRYFTLQADVATIEEAEELFRAGQIDLVIAFSPDFAEHLRAGGDASIQVLSDGTEPNQASVRAGYAQQVLAGYAVDLAAAAGTAQRPQYSVDVQTTMLYNPQSKSEYNFVPAVIGMILLLICVMMTSISIVREKEMGTMEILLASPLPPAVIILAKLVPYFAISAVNLATILILSKFMLGIPIAGSLLGFIGITLLYIFVALALGLFISSVVNSQLAAMFLSILMIVPTMYLSGMVFQVESMPAPAQYASVIVPARWYMSVARKLLIQGVELRYVVQETLVLGTMAVVLLGVAWRMFKTRLE